MADKRVEVEFVANTQAFQKGLKTTLSELQELEKFTKQLKKEGNRSKGSEKGVASWKKNLGQQALRHEREVKKAIKESTAALKEKNKEGKFTMFALQSEMKHLQSLKKMYKDIRADRQATGVKTWGEKAGGAFRGQGGVGKGMKDTAGLVGSAIFKGAKVGMIKVAAAITGAVISQIRTGFQARENYGQAYGGLIGMGGSKAGLDRMASRAVGFGYTHSETAQHAKTVARATGHMGATTQAQALSRTTGMDVGEASGFMGTLARGGRGFGQGGSGKRDMVKVLSMGFQSGLERARMPEFFEGVTSLVEKQSAMTAGDVDPTGIARIMASMGMSGHSGFQGQRGAAVLSQMDKTIRDPGGGEHGKALMLRAMGFGKPGGDASYYDALKQQQRGVSDPDNLVRLFQQSKQEYGGGEAQMLALHEMSGLSLDNLEALREVVESNLSNEEKQTELNKIAESSKSIEEQALVQMTKGFGDTVQELARVDAHNIEVGNQFREVLLKIRILIEKIVTEFLPAMKVALEMVVDIMREVHFAIMEIAGHKVEKEIREAIRHGDTTMRTVNQQYAEGTITGAQARERLTKEADNLKKVRETGPYSGWSAVRMPIDFWSDIITGGSSNFFDRARRQHDMHDQEQGLRARAAGNMGPTSTGLGTYLSDPSHRDAFRDTLTRDNPLSREYQSIVSTAPTDDARHALLMEYFQRNQEQIARLAAIVESQATEARESSRANSRRIAQRGSAVTPTP